MAGGSRRTVAFVDGQNLYHAVRRCFGYPLPSYDVTRLARTVCAGRGWDLWEVLLLAPGEYTLLLGEKAFPILVGERGPQEVVIRVGF